MTWLMQHVDLAGNKATSLACTLGAMHNSPLRHSSCMLPSAPQGKIAPGAQVRNPGNMEVVF